jgi:hypothetical protein
MEPLAVEVPLLLLLLEVMPQRTQEVVAVAVEFLAPAHWGKVAVQEATLRN